MTNLKLILASGSAGRKKILNTLKIPFEVVESNVDEDKINPPDPIKLVSSRAEAKGKAVESSLPPNSPSLIIAADSMVVLDGKAYGKAKTNEEAKEFLKILSGKTHTFITAVWVKNTKTGKIYKNYCQSRVTLRELTEEEIDWYAKTDDLKKYAGAYSMTDSPQSFITNLKGSITNVVGLPLELLIPILKKETLL